MQNIKQFLEEHGSFKIIAITIFTAVGFLLSLYLVTLSINEAKRFQYIGRDMPATQVLPVNGRGEITVVADIATFTLSVIEEGKTASDAQAKATAKNNAIVNYLKENGVEAKDVQATGYNVYPQYDYSGGCKVGQVCPPAKPVISGYEINQTLTIKVRKADDAGKLLSGVGGLGASNISGLTFTSDNIDELKKQARDLAIADAQAQAASIASQLGVNLGSLISFYEVNDGSTPEYYAKGGDMVRSSMAVQANPEIPRGENKIVSQVSLSYEIR